MFEVAAVLHIFPRKFALLPVLDVVTADVKISPHLNSFFFLTPLSTDTLTNVDLRHLHLQTRRFVASDMDSLHFHSELAPSLVRTCSGRPITR